ncbi:MAG TPA: hypothetical protein VM164_04480 [Burkholderiales bacterium]|nr:hypothetical protein [Burkholderiales bacterium]
MLSRKPVGSPEILATPEGAAIAGWEQLTIELSAGAAGLRHIMVVLDATGQAISAGDTVLYQRKRASQRDATGAGDDTEFYQESVGGRIEPDGSFRGTRWRTVGLDKADSDEPQLESTPSAPTEADVIGIKALVAEVMRRMPAKS